MKKYSLKNKKFWHKNEKSEEVLKIQISQKNDKIWLEKWKKVAQNIHWISTSTNVSTHFDKKFRDHFCSKFSVIPKRCVFLLKNTETRFPEQTNFCKIQPPKRSTSWRGRRRMFFRLIKKPSPTVFRNETWNANFFLFRTWYRLGWWRK